LISGAPVTSGYVVDLADTPVTPFAPKWSVQVGGRYEVEVAMDMKAYARADYRWTSKYVTSFAGTQTYAPDAAVGIANDRLNLRAGIETHGFDINLFAQKGNVTGGRGGCPIDPSGACPTFTAYNPFLQTNYAPRVYGLQIAYRHWFERPPPPGSLPAAVRPSADLRFLSRGADIRAQFLPNPGY
jgi:hypothetical protein